MALTQIFANQAQTTLAGAITATSLTANLSPGSGALFPSPSTGEYFTMIFNDAATGLLYEEVWVTNVSGDTITMIRGQEGSTAKSWIAGDIAFNGWTAGSASNLVQASQAQSNAFVYALDSGGAANTYAIALDPAMQTGIDGAIVYFKPAHTNTGASTLTVNAGTSYSLLGAAQLPLQGGEILANGFAAAEFNSTLGAYVLLYCTGGTTQVVDAAQSHQAISLSQAQSLGTSKIQSLSASVAANALTISYAGGVLDFRSTTASSGTPNTSVVVPANSITVPSGATLGTISGQLSQIVMVEYYNGGSPVAGVINLAGGTLLDETNLASPTTITSGATSASTFYSASAVTGPTSYRVIGMITSTQATAGTWATAPSQVQGVGGLALANLGSLGDGQTWQTFTVGTQRVSGTTYYNTTGRPIQVGVLVNATNGTTFIINGVTVATPQSFSTAILYNYTIPPGGSYSCSTAGSAIYTWAELR